MAEHINWQHIQEDYENGISLGQLSILYGVPKSTLGDKSKAGRWTRTIGGRRTPPKQENVDAPVEAVELAREGLKDLRLFMRGEESRMSASTHATVAQALTQYTKVIASAPVQEAINGPQMMIDPEAVKHMTVEERDTLQGLLKIGRERMEENARLKRA